MGGGTYADTDKLQCQAAASRDLRINVKHRQHKGLNNRAENLHQPTRVREKVMRRFKSARQLQRFASIHDQLGNLFMHCRYHANARRKRALRTQAPRDVGKLNYVVAITRISWIHGSLR